MGDGMPSSVLFGGMRISSTARSGSYSRTAFSAWSASIASATTSHPNSVSTEVIPLRMSMESSAITIRMGAPP